MAKPGKALGAGMLLIFSGIFAIFFIPEIAQSIQENTASNELSTLIVSFIAMSIVLIITMIFAVLVRGE